MKNNKLKKKTGIVQYSEYTIITLTVQKMHSKCNHYALINDFLQVNSSKKGIALTVNVKLKYLINVVKV